MSDYTYNGNGKKVKVTIPEGEEYFPLDDSDNENPKFIFSMTSSSLLVGIIKGELDPVQLAARELSNRGLGLNSEWVGFKQSEQLLKEYLNKRGGKK